MKFRKAQSAMEYLMTYGWAILVVLIVIAALFYLGVFDSKSDIKQGVEGPFTYDLKVGNNGMQISLKTPSVIKSATVESITVTGSDNVAVDCTPDNSQLSGGSTTLITCNNGNIDLSTGESANVVIGLTYTQQNSQLPHTINIVKKGIAETATFTVNAENGVCGSANGQSYSAAPSGAILCNSGSASSVTANYPSLKWEWICNGQNGGTNSPQCTANIISALSLNSDIVALFHLDEQNGNIAADETNLHSGTITGTVGLVPGKMGNGYYFNGNAGNLVNTGNSYTIGQPFTVSAWIKPGTYTLGSYTYCGGRFGNIFTKGGNSDSGDWMLATGAEITGICKIDFRTRTSGTTYNQGLTSSGTYSVNNWHNIVVTLDGNIMKIYIDKTLQTTKTIVLPRLTGTQPAVIGNIAAGNYPFSGIIDEVMLINKALTQGEVNTLYDEQNSGRAYYYP